LTTGSRIGIDLGGSKIEGVVVCGPHEATRIVERERIPTEAIAGYEHILERVAGLVKRLDDRIDEKAPIGVGMPGSVTAGGMVKNSNTICLNGTRFREDLERRVGRDITFANDANCFALAEATLGAGVGYDMVFGVIMGTGTGGGLVIGGVMREGPQSICGEWGHMTLWPMSDRRCYCGRKGCVETYLAGPWIERDYVRMGGAEIRLPDIIERRKGGDPVAQRCIETWLDAYGRAMANAINILDPDVVVLGGGVSNADCLYDEGTARVAEHIFSNELTTPILRHRIGDSAGVIGAALLV
jgi:fructokinase